MTDKKSNDSRRKLLKTIAAGSGAVVAGKSLPESWSKPVIDSVILPAHAATTDNNDSEDLSTDTTTLPPSPVRL
ncbi:MAG: twin-arginine translocation signal domain-containing protein, partial [Proteobacteria bacterium]|nr:twin-arginine translocation signal domain-containing protein [Pseudomonadota bacterium]